MRRGYLWVDWVELGCRGWDIDSTGAGLYGDQEGMIDIGDPAVCHSWDHAHLDKTTLHIMVGGCRQFLCRVLNDLIASGLLISPPRVTTTTTDDSGGSMQTVWTYLRTFHGT